MLKIAVFPNVSKPDSAKVLKRIFQFYEDKDVELMLPVDESRFFGMEEYGVPNIEQVRADIALSPGGDGTLLGVGRRYGAMEVPVGGVNIGTLGFMADIEPDELERKLQKLLEGDYHIDPA